jgi:hypothetical protein
VWLIKISDLSEITNSQLSNRCCDNCEENNEEEGTHCSLKYDKKDDDEIYELKGSLKKLR